MSITVEEARNEAFEGVRSIARESGIPMVLLENETIRRRSGWLFFYSSEAYVRTGDFRHALVGNGPVFVTDSGEVELLPTAVHWAEALGDR